MSAFQLHKLIDISSELSALFASSATSSFPTELSSSFSSFSTFSNPSLLTLGPLLASRGLLFLPSSGVTELDELCLLASFFPPFFGLFVFHGF